MEDFDFGVEAFGDGVVFGEAPPGGDLVFPGKESIAESSHGGQRALA